MKKMLVILILVCMTIPLACAEDVDISGLSYDELLILRSRVDAAILECEEWQEVTVPVGIWKVGEDIPAGKWTLRCASDKYSFVTIGTKLRDNGLSISTTGDHYASSTVFSPNYKDFKPGDNPTEIYITVTDGDYIHIGQASVIFSPYSGKPDLGFK